jgi:carbon-monoxide dehydrogenase medium subunit
MKPVDFAYERPRTLSDAISLLASSENAKVMAGGQTLGPMLNLRFVQPDTIIDIRHIWELMRVEEHADRIVLGACTTHAAVEDGKTPDAWRGILQRVASGIAYRAVRTRGTIGGSLAHADPAADWVSCLTALRATVSVSGAVGKRTLAIEDFVRGALDTVLGPDELIDSVELPRLSSGARWGWHKICRKTGEFAEAIGAVVIDRDRCRIVSGATSGRVIVVECPADEVVGKAITSSEIGARLMSAGLSGDRYEMNVHTAAVGRAMTEALGR